MTATFASPARFFVSTKGTRWIKFVKCIRPDDSRLQVLARPENARTFLAPDACREPKGGVIGLLNGLSRGSEGQDG